MEYPTSWAGALVTVAAVLLLISLVFTASIYGFAIAAAVIVIVALAAYYSGIRVDKWLKGEY